MAVPGVRTRVGGSVVNAERLVVAFLALVVLAVVLARGGWRWRRPTLVEAGLATFILANALGSIGDGPVVALELKITLLLVVSSAPLLLVPLIANDAGLARLGFVSIILAGAVEAVAGLGLLVVYYLSGAHLPGLDTDPLSNAPYPTVTQWEANTFGSFVAAAMVAAVAYRLQLPRGSRHRRLLEAAIAVMAVAVALNLSRGAWLGAAFGVIAVLLLLRRWRLGIILGGIALVALVAALLVNPARLPAGLAPVVARLQSIGGVVSGVPDNTTRNRFAANKTAVVRFLLHPYVGRGPTSAGETGTSLATGHLYVGNIVLRVLADSGVLGFVGITAALGGALLVMLGGLRRGPPPELMAMIAGVVGAEICLVVAFQATDATWLAYPWFMVGVGLALAVRRSSTGPPAEAQVTASA